MAELVAQKKKRPRVRPLQPTKDLQVRPLIVAGEVPRERSLGSRGQAEAPRHPGQKRCPRAERDRGQMKGADGATSCWQEAG